jgi:hypothetical protein
MEGLDDGDDGSGSDRAYRDTSVYPGSGPSQLEVNPYFLPTSY